MIIVKFIGFYPMLYPQNSISKIKTDTYDDFLAKVPDSFKPLTAKIANIIFNHIEKIRKEIEKFVNSIPSDLLYTLDEINNYYKFTKMLSENILPQINPKLPKNAKTEIEQIILKRAFGKEAADKWTMEEVERLWNLIPDYLKDQKTTKESQDN